MLVNLAVPRQMRNDMQMWARHPDLTRCVPLAAYMLGNSITSNIDVVRHCPRMQQREEQQGTSWAANSLYLLRMPWLHAAQACTVSAVQPPQHVCLTHTHTSALLYGCPALPTSVHCRLLQSLSCCHCCTSSCLCCGCL